MAPATRPNTLLQRLIGAMALDSAIYEEVEADWAATAQAFGIVLVSSIAAGVGSANAGVNSVHNIIFISVVALLAWAAWALLTYVIGTQLLPEPETRSDVGELLRTIGFASTPGLLRVFGLMQAARIPAFVIAEVWMIAAMIVGVRQALDYRSTGRAVAVCVLGWVLATAFAVVLGVVFGPAVS